jgi:indole-3-acetate monooxygenase
MSVGPMGPGADRALTQSPDCRIIDTWDVSGLRATGSHDSPTFSCPSTDAFHFLRRHRYRPVTLFKFPIFALFAVGMAAAAHGIARAAIDELTRLAKQKTAFGMASTLSARATCSGRALLVARVGSPPDGRDSLGPGPRALAPGSDQRDA